MPRVLLVDNDTSVRRALARTLGLAGFDVASFESVQALLDAGGVARDACLLLDVDMPGVNGVDLKKALVRAGRDVPTIFITASGREGLHAQLAALEPVAVLHKPFNKEDLLHALDRAFA